MRLISGVVGLALIALAVAAAFRVADTREGLVAEVVTLLAGLAGISLLLYGLLAQARPGQSVAHQSAEVVNPEPSIRTANDLLIAVMGIVVAIILMSGLVTTAGILWAVTGFVILLPMIVGSLYLGLRFIRAPQRKWRFELRPFREGSRQKKHTDRDQDRRPDHIPADKSQVIGEKDRPGDHQHQPDHH
jgi:hypothetical protein